MAFAVYVHIPYCLQRCRYCDFTTFEWSEILPPEGYVKWVVQEIRSRRHLWRENEISTLYFGGGTPSLIEPQLIVSICAELAKVGFSLTHDCEITIEINPGTLDEAKLETYLAAGINRFSVGAQTFNERLLKVCGRKHSAKETRKTLELLSSRHLNYSFDLLFALPTQTLEELKQDLTEIKSWNPQHLSPYCLTLPEGHSMNAGRPPEGEQIEMFALIESELKEIGMSRYEISNFSKPHFESRHNLAYWNDVNYWGLGLSSHSYQKELGSWGTRFWNPNSLKVYERQVHATGYDFVHLLPSDQLESLSMFEAASDFALVSLRKHTGLSHVAAQQRFPDFICEELFRRLESLRQHGWIESAGNFSRLTSKGVLVSNKVFEELTFLPTEPAFTRLTAAQTNPYCAL